MSRSSTIPPAGLAARVRAKLSPLGNAQAQSTSPLGRIAARVRRPLDRAHLRRFGRLGDLAALAVPVDGLAPPDGAPRVLILMLRGWPAHAACEATIAQALRLRGAEVALLTCGGGQPICEMGWGRRVFPRPCDRCGWYTDRVAAALGVPAFRLGDEFAWGRDSSRAPAEPLSGGSGATGISAPWLLKTADPGVAPEGGEVVADFERSAAAVRQAAGHALDRFRPDVVFMVNGLFTGERVVRDLARERGLRVPTYEIAPRGGALCFSQETAAPEHDTDQIWSEVADRPLRPEQDEALEQLLRDRARGVGAHESYFDSVAEDEPAIRAELGLEEARRVLSLFTNLSWDSAALYHDVGFRSMLDWVEHAVRAAGEIDDCTLVVRVHPAERKWGTRETVQEVLAERLGGALPPQVRIVGPTNPLSSYALLAISDLCLTYTTTVGLEAAVRGVPVAVAGRTHYRGRGFTLDIGGPDELERAMRTPQEHVAGERLDLARRYAFAYFFRAMIPFAPVDLVAGRPRAVAASSEQLGPGLDRRLDWICDRILDGRDFGLPDELTVP
jgi:capsular polysaccharide biosynthesis protein